jgi:hypothetical protein
LFGIVVNAVSIGHFTSFGSPQNGHVTPCGVSFALLNGPETVKVFLHFVQVMIFSMGAHHLAFALAFDLGLGIARKHPLLFSPASPCSLLCDFTSPLRADLLKPSGSCFFGAEPSHRSSVGVLSLLHAWHSSMLIRVRTVRKTLFRPAMNCGTEACQGIKQWPPSRAVRVVPASSWESEALRNHAVVDQPPAFVLNDTTHGIV